MSADARKIVNVARESLKAGMKMIRPDNTIGDIGWAIQQYAEGEGCSVVRDFVGHGVGIDFHEAPRSPITEKKGQGLKLIPGMTFTVEPMINLGKKELHILPDNGPLLLMMVHYPHSLNRHFLLPNRVMKALPLLTLMPSFKNVRYDRKNEIKGL